MKIAPTKKSRDLLILAVLFATLSSSCEGAPSGSPPVAAADPAPQDTPPTGAITIGADSPLQPFENDNRYVLFDIDVNLDGVLDKVVSSAKNSGNELLFFENINGHFVLKLTSINLTEDGGRVLFGASPVAKNKDSDVLIIETYFPQGTDVAKHYVSYRDDQWFLSRTEFEISDWRVDASRTYTCDVTQGMPMKSLVSSDGASSVRQIPEEALRQKECRIK